MALKDSYGREIDYLRLSITDRCNLRCRYCMPPEGIDHKISHDQTLSLEDFARVVRCAASIGIRRVRITGGEPLVRKNIQALIAAIRNTEGINEISMTTNGILFSTMGDSLRDAGLDRVNFSLDTLQADRFKYITRGGRLADVFAALEKAGALGMDPVKVNVVVIRGFNDDELFDFADLTQKKRIHVRFIEMMPVGVLDFNKSDRVIPVEEIQKRLQERFVLRKDIQLKGNGPAEYWQIEGAKGTLGFISPVSRHFCSSCNRLRMNTEGKIRVCLLNPGELDLKPALLQKNDQAIIRGLQEAIRMKPEKTGLLQNEDYGDQKKMYKIGG